MESIGCLAWEMTQDWVHLLELQSFYHALLSPPLQKDTLKWGSFMDLFHLRTLGGALHAHLYSQPAKLLHLCCVLEDPDFCQ